ncbi:surface lipoprotein assembly modifier [Pseudogemmobacter sp. W21_MBD1_M6]|uniref:surface lipoprotein assembly modifier n=1 Tax=Pseudogemmobacter sp. W21_MBD1_M6 TaxID=3240271 RepID=UPI003F9B2D3F
MRISTNLGLACLVVLWAGTANAQTLTLTPDQVRMTAVTAIEQNQPRIALDLSNALLQRDRTDFFALLINSRAARNLGLVDQSKASALAAWRLAKTPDQKFQSSLLMAQALSSAGARTRAQLWLRRAVQHAPTDQARQLAIRDFAYVRSRNPWSTSLSFNISPTSNVNNGSANTTTRLFDLPFEFKLSGDAQALSGTEISAGISTTYKFAASDSGQTAVNLRYFSRGYVLSEDAKAKAPMAKGSDYAFSTASVSLSRRVFGSTPQSPLDLSIGAGQNWYGGSPYTHFIQGRATKTLALANNQSLSFTLGADKQISDTNQPDVHSLSAGTSYARRFKTGGRVQFGLDIANSTSDAENNNFTLRRVSATYQLPKPVLTAHIVLSAALQARDFPLSAYSAAGRQDTTIEGGITLIFDKVDYYGFAPTLSLNASSNRSNIGLYETREYGVRVGFQSAF